MTTKGDFKELFFYEKRGDFPRGIRYKTNWREGDLKRIKSYEWGGGEKENLVQPLMGNNPIVASLSIHALRIGKRGSDYLFDRFAQFHPINSTLGPHFWISRLGKSRPLISSLFKNSKTH